MPLRNDVAGEPLAPVVVMTKRARQVELPLPLVEELPAGGRERCEPFIRWRRYRLASRLARHIGRQRKQIVALIAQRRRLLALGAFEIDALCEVDRPAAWDVESRIAGCHSPHALRCAAGAVGARAVGGAGLGAP